MATSRGISGTAVGALAFGGLLIYAAVTDQPIADALRTLVKGVASGPSPFVKPSSGSGSASGISGGSFPELASAAQKYLGRPYRWGGNFDPPNGGGDCSGLVWRSFHDFGINAPRVSSAQLMWNQVRKISRAEVSAGDLVGHFGAPGHIGIAVSNTEAIFSPDLGSVVQIQNFDNVLSKFAAIYVRYVGPKGTTGGGGGLRPQ